MWCIPLGQLEESSFYYNTLRVQISFNCWLFPIIEGTNERGIELNRTTINVPVSVMISLEYIQTILWLIGIKLQKEGQKQWRRRSICGVPTKLSRDLEGCPILPPLEVWTRKQWKSEKREGMRVGFAGKLDQVGSNRCCLIVHQIFNRVTNQSKH